MTPFLVGDSQQHVVDFLARYGFLILMALVLTPVLGSMFGEIISVPIGGITYAFRWVTGLGVGS